MSRRKPVTPPPPDLRLQVEELQRALLAARYALDLASNYVGARPEPGVAHEIMASTLADTLACVDKALEVKS